MTPQDLNEETDGAVAQERLVRLLDVMEQYPDLTYFGFGCFNGFRNRLNADEIEKLRDELKAAIDQIDAARSWIKKHCSKRKTINKNAGSYWLKHRIEDAVNLYISNGACIAAFILEGYRVHRSADFGPNCAFDVKIQTNSQDQVRP